MLSYVFCSNTWIVNGFCVTSWPDSLSQVNAISKASCCHSTLVIVDRIQLWSTGFEVNCSPSDRSADGLLWNTSAPCRRSRGNFCSSLLNGSCLGRAMRPVDEALRKLAPLRPGEVERWRRLLAYADEKSRRLVEWDVLRTAEEVLGKEQRLLLSCPPAEVCKGEIDLG